MCATFSVKCIWCIMRCIEYNIDDIETTDGWKISLEYRVVHVCTKKDPSLLCPPNPMVFSREPMLPEHADPDTGVERPKLTSPHILG